MCSSDLWGGMSFKQTGNVCLVDACDNHDDVPPHKDQQACSTLVTFRFLAALAVVKVGRCEKNWLVAKTIFTSPCVTHSESVGHVAVCFLFMLLHLGGEGGSKPSVLMFRIWGWFHCFNFWSFQCPEEVGSEDPTWQPDNCWKQSRSNMSCLTFGR